MDQIINVVMAIDKTHTALLDCGPGLGRLNQGYWPNYFTPSGKSICGIYDIIFTYAQLGVNLISF